MIHLKKSSIIDSTWGLHEYKAVEHENSVNKNAFLLAPLTENQLVMPIESPSGVQTNDTKTNIKLRKNK